MKSWEDEIFPTIESLSVREAARRRFPLDGANAQALEGALAMTERERDDLAGAIEGMINLCRLDCESLESCCGICEIGFKALKKIPRRKP